MGSVTTGYVSSHVRSVDSIQFLSQELRSLALFLLHLLISEFGIFVVVCWFKCFILSLGRFSSLGHGVLSASTDASTPHRCDSFNLVFLFQHLVDLRRSRPTVHVWLYSLKLWYNLKISNFVLHRFLLFWNIFNATPLYFSKFTFYLRKVSTSLGNVGRHF